MKVSYVITPELNGHFSLSIYDMTFRKLDKTLYFDSELEVFYYLYTMFNSKVAA